MTLMQNYFAPSLFLNHGGGPNPVLGRESDKEIAEALRNVAKLVKLDQLKAIILVSAHRQEDVVTISSGKYHETVFDYSNFPPENYIFKHNAPGDPVLALRIHEAFKNAGIESQMDDKRGWDHGVFIPMMLIDPDAKVPIVEVSVLKTHNARNHFDIGKVLYQFRQDSVAVFGSGMTFHNMPILLGSLTQNDGVVVNEKFDCFLNKVCTGTDYKEEILDWDKAPQALVSQPIGGADHLMPLIVCVGASGTDKGKNIFSSLYKGKMLLSGFMWDKDF